MSTFFEQLVQTQENTHLLEHQHFSARRKRNFFSHPNSIYRIAKNGPYTAPSAYACVLRTSNFAKVCEKDGDPPPAPRAAFGQFWVTQARRPTQRRRPRSGWRHLNVPWSATTRLRHHGRPRRALGPAPPRPTARPGVRSSGPPAASPGNRCARRGLPDAETRERGRTHHVRRGRRGLPGTGETHPHREAGECQLRDRPRVPSGRARRVPSRAGRPAARLRPLLQRSLLLAAPPHPCSCLRPPDAAPHPHLRGPRPASARRPWDEASVPGNACCGQHAAVRWKNLIRGSPRAWPLTNG